VLEGFRSWSGPLFEHVRGKQTERRRIVSLTPLKRTLDQFKSLEEVIAALLDAARGMVSFPRIPLQPIDGCTTAVKALGEIGLVHQDLSPSNILLADDCLSGPECTPGAQGVFVRRPHGPQTGGLLNDFDMAGRVRQPKVLDLASDMRQFVEFGVCL
jgi:serine/threonine protein kinase